MGLLAHPQVYSEISIWADCKNELRNTVCVNTWRSPWLSERKGDPTAETAAHLSGDTLPKASAQWSHTSSLLLWFSHIITCTCVVVFTHIVSDIDRTRDSSFISRYYGRVRKWHPELLGTYKPLPAYEECFIFLQLSVEAISALSGRALVLLVSVPSCLEKRLEWWRMNGDVP